MTVIGLSTIQTLEDSNAKRASVLLRVEFDRIGNWEFAGHQPQKPGPTPAGEAR